MGMATSAISGVNPQRETLVMSTFPAIGAWSLGRLVGQLMESIPAKIGGIKLSYIVFGPLLAVPGVKLYAALKLFDVRYSITNRSLQKRTVLTNNPVVSVPLEEIATLEIEQLSGQEFFPCADIYALNAKNEVLLHLPGVPRADVFRQIILDARNARVQVAKSLATINARHAGN